MKENVKLEKSEAIAYIACKLMALPMGSDEFTAELAVGTYTRLNKFFPIVTMSCIRKEVELIHNDYMSWGLV